MCNRDKLAGLIHDPQTLPKPDEFLAEHITYADSSRFCVLSQYSFPSVFNAWTNSSTMHENCHCTHLQK